MKKRKELENKMHGTIHYFIDAVFPFLKVRVDYYYCNDFINA